MGVPGFYRWLVQRYPLIRRNMSDSSRPRFNNAYIDMNGVFYKSLEVSHIQGDRINREFISEVLRYLDMLVQITRPSDVLFIAVDGPAPAAKASQQRHRRYMAAKNYIDGSFKSVSFTPGTENMYEIHQELMKFIEEKARTDLTWMKPKIIYSSSMVPGEGEHKILDYIRMRRAMDDWKPDQTHVLYSTDADLIFLGLQTHEPYFSIIREADASAYQKEVQSFEIKSAKTKYGYNNFELLHISMIRDYITLDFNVKGYDLEKTIDDFVALSLFIGNDFIPDFHDVIIQKGGFNVVVNVYKKIKETEKGFLVENGTFNKPFLKMVVEGISNFFECYYIENCMYAQGADHFTYLDANKRYLLSKYPQNKDDFEKLVKDMSFHILEAFYWVLQYYNSGCPSWTWKYPYLYSPPLLLILPYIEEFEPKFELGEPVTPFLQELLIFPPKFKCLLPKCLRTIVTKNPITTKYYPTEIKLDYNGKKNEYQAVVLLPHMDDEIIKQEYDKLVCKLTEEEKERNKLMKALEFYHDSTEPKEIEVISKRNLSKLFTKEMPPCVPTLFNIDITSELKLIPVICFEYPSNYESIKITPNSKNSDIKDIKSIINQRILFDWPYVKPGYVVDVYSKDGTHYVNDEITKCDKPNIKKYIKKYLTKYALNLQEIDFLVEVRQYNSSSIDESSFSFQKKSKLIPFQLTFPIDKFNTMERFQAFSSLPQEGSPIIYNSRYSGIITKVIDKSTYNIKYSKPRIIDIRKIVNNDANEWISDEELTKKLFISFHSLREIMTSVYIQGVKGNIAFQLYNTKKTEVIKGYCKIDKNNEKKIYFHKSVLELLKEYFKLTGNLKTLLENEWKKNSSTKINSIQVQKKGSAFTLEKIYGTSSKTFHQAKIDELKKWLNYNSPASLAPSVPSDEIHLSYQTVKKIENAIQSSINIEKKTDLESIDESELKWCGKVEENNSTILPTLGKRVISKASSGSVKFGSYGTVVGIHPSNDTVEVIFDDVLQCGTNLDGSLSSLRGQVMLSSDLIIL